jgi:glycosyltransferase involved in cell wall biosynthesis
MKIFLENVNLNASSGPNSFAKKIIPHMVESGNEFTQHTAADISLCFIESPMENLQIPRIQRLDGIYYNTRFQYELQNKNIKRTYDNSNGVIYQSHYGKKLVEKFFGIHRASTVIHNGADLFSISKAVPMNNQIPDRKIWSCAASWRPHKRLSENIRYFMEHKSEKDILIIAGKAEETIKDPSIFYIGNLTQDNLYSLYKASDYFIHLAYLDCCPNVVVDARACGAKVICTTSGGTKEIAGKDSILIDEPEWNFEPIDLYNPPKIDFEKKIDNEWNTCYDISVISNKYLKFMRSFI